MLRHDRVLLPAIIAIAALLVSACGSGSSGGRSGGVPGVAVIQGWSSALRKGDVQAAARYFAIPSVFDDGQGQPTDIRNVAQAQAVNEALPCGAKFISASRHGRYLNALFRLTSRPGPGGGDCGSGAGQTARTNFVIRRGRIAAWIRAPDQPGDNGSPGTSTSPGGNPVV